MQASELSDKNGIESTNISSGSEITVPTAGEILVYENRGRRMTVYVTPVRSRWRFS